MTVVGDIQPVKRRWGCSCGGQHLARSRPCGTVLLDDDHVRLPDLALYSQAEAIEAGREPTWDSPDIMTNSAMPFRLLRQASVRIRNIGAASATDAYVHLFLSPFGIGTPQVLFGSRRVSIETGGEITLSFPFDEATLAGDQRIGAHVQIEHPFDTHLINNAGSQVVVSHFTTEVGRTHSIEIPVVNDSPVSRRIELIVLPTDITTTLTPTHHIFAAHEQITVALEMRVPDALIGSPSDFHQRSVTVIARADGGALVGGVTRHLQIDS